jgi:hypothetical protein
MASPSRTTTRGHAAHLAGLGGDADAMRRPDERHGRLARRAGDLERGRATGVGQRTAREERAAPDGGEIVARARGELVRQPAHRTATRIEQTGLTRERLAAFDDADGEVPPARPPDAWTRCSSGAPRRAP